MPNLCVVPARAVSDARLTHRDLRALLAVGMYTNHAGKGVWASQTTMAERVNMSRQQMNESLKRLEEYGYIVKRRRWNAAGAELTCLIDIRLDDPVAETGGVPDLGTGGVPDLGTQTTQLNDPTTDDDAMRAGMGDYLTDLDAMLTQARNPTAVTRELHALHSGMHGSYSWPVIGRAVHDMMVAGASVSPRSLRAFCEGATRAAFTPATTTPRKTRGPDLAALEKKLAAKPEEG